MSGRSYRTRRGRGAARAGPQSPQRDREKGRLSPIANLLHQRNRLGVWVPPRGGAQQDPKAVGLGPAVEESPCDLEEAPKLGALHHSRELQDSHGVQARAHDARVRVAALLRAAGGARLGSLRRALELAPVGCRLDDGLDAGVPIDLLPLSSHGIELVERGRVVLLQPALDFS